MMPQAVSKCLTNRSALIILVIALLLILPSPFVRQAYAEPDFDVTLYPSEISIAQGSTGAITVFITSMNDFASPVTISLNYDSLVGIGANIPVNQVTPTAEKDAFVVVSFDISASKPVGAWPVTLHAVSSTVSHDIELVINVMPPTDPDFTISCDPSTITLRLDDRDSSRCSIASLNGFEDDVALSGQWLPSAPAGVEFEIPESVTPSPAESAEATLIATKSADASPGAFILHVFANSGQLAHDTYVRIEIFAFGFTIEASPASLSIGPGTYATSTVTAVASGGFSSPVTFSSTAPTGLTLNFSPAQVTLEPGSTATSTLTVTVSGAPLGTYPVTIRGTGGDTVRTTPLSVHVVAHGGCLIVTATYGSAMAPEVVYMRYVRDNLIGSTPTGKILRDGFNTFYYLWSPTVAGAIAENGALRALFRVIILPLVGIVRLSGMVFQALGGGDAASIAAFALAAALSVATYVALPTIGIWAALRFRVKR